MKESPFDAVDYNRRAWNNEVEGGENPWTKPVASDVIERARKGEFEIVLTPLIPVPRDWFPDSLENVDVLCLASGGGQQAPILAAAGANVTSFDNSDAQLAQDRLVADREGLEIRTVQGDAADLSVFGDESFDLVWHPVSNCFFPEIQPVWNEAYRVLRPGGTMLAGFLNPLVFLFDRIREEQDQVLELRFSLPYSEPRDLNEEELRYFVERSEPLEFGHTLDQQIGGQIRAGFVIDGFFEDYFEEGGSLLNDHTPTFIATRARKPE